MDYRVYGAMFVSLWMGGCSLMEPFKPDIADKEWRSLSSNATIRFENGRISGSDGCNRYASSYTANQNSLVISDKMISTKMACEAERMQSADRFRRALMESKSYRINNNRLTLLGDKEVVVGEFMTGE